MPFTKGKSGNPEGRPQGSKNKSSEEIRELIMEFLDNNIDTIQKDFDKLEAPDRLKFLEKLLSYAIPRMRSTYLELENVNAPSIQIVVDNEKAKNEHGKQLEALRRKLNGED